MSNTITIELCQEDRERLDEIIAGLAKIAGAAVAEAVPLIAEAVATVAAAEHPIDAVAPHGEPEKLEAPKYTKADIQAKVQKLAKPDNPKREQAKAIVKSYAAKVSDIPEDKFAEVMAKLTALEG